MPDRRQPGTRPGDRDPVPNFRIAGIQTVLRNITEHFAVTGEKRIHHRRVEIRIDRKVAQATGSNERDPDIFRPCLRRLRQSLPEGVTPRRGRLGSAGNTY